jgi:hypothetical protein
MKFFFFLVATTLFFLSCEPDNIDAGDTTCSRLTGDWCHKDLSPADKSRCDFRISFKSNGTCDGDVLGYEEYSSNCSTIDFYQTLLNEKYVINTWIIVSLTNDELVVQTDRFDNNSKVTYWRWK